MASSVQIRKLFSDYAQARFLNFTIYLFYSKSSTEALLLPKYKIKTTVNLKLWRLYKYA